MHAIVQDRYGSTDMLRSRDIARPAIKDREVLVRVRAAGLHIGDSFVMRGSPAFVRLMTGLRRPKVGVPGLDLAGEVIDVGASVTRFGTGDEVFGTGRGSCAEFVATTEDELVVKPAGLTFAEAAAIPTSGLAALHGLRDAAGLRAGQHVLINGASGGVGAFAVQIAKALGAEVTGVCGPQNVDLVRSIGADHVIDYTKVAFTVGDERYDVILDNVENRSMSACRRVLLPGGTLVLNSPTGTGGLGLLVRLIRPVAVSPFVSHRLRRYLSNPSQADLVILRDLVESGTVKPVIDRIYPLQETPAAIRHIETGHARGKVVVTV